MGNLARLFALILGIFVLTFAAFYFVQNSQDETSNVISGHGAIVQSEEQFIFEMIPHHQEAVDTAMIVFEKTENAELKKLAENIINAQTREIEMMDGWKSNWYPDSNYNVNYISMMPPLKSLSGDDLDKSFLQGMIMHHQMAIFMAEQVSVLNPRDEIQDFADDVIEVQSSEIRQMQEMLEDYK